MTIPRHALFFALAGLFVVWWVFAWLVAPPVISSAYEGHGPSFLTDLMQGRGEHPVDFYLAKWRMLGLEISAVWLILLPACLPRFRRAPWPGVMILLLAGALMLEQIPEDPSQLRVSSHETVASGLVEGYGLSTIKGYRDAHIGTPSYLMESDAHLRTAIKEPAYASLIAASVLVFGDGSRRAMLVFNVACFVLAAGALYGLGRAAFGRYAGLLAAGIWLLLPFGRHLALYNLSNEVLAALAITLAVWATVVCVQAPTLRRGLLAGGAIGFASLVHAGSTSLVAGAVLLLALPSSVAASTRWKAAAAVALAAAVVLLPWTLRNFLVFGELVPVRTGFGVTLYTQNPILAGTYSPGPHACSEVFDPIWPARDASDALDQLAERSRRHELYYRARDCFEHTPPPGYEHMNEAQIDGEYQRRGVEFLLHQPRLTFELSVQRAWRFFISDVEWERRALTVLALVGALVALALPGGRVVVVALALLSAPYAAAVALFSRYRFPLEPLIVVLASATVVWGSARAVSRVRRRLDRRQPS